MQSNHPRHITALLMFALAVSAGCAATRADRAKRLEDQNQRQEERLDDRQERIEEKKLDSDDPDRTERLDDRQQRLEHREEVLDEADGKADPDRA